MPAHPSPRVQSMAEQVGDHMDAILTFFKPGAKISVLVRRPGKPDGSQDFFITNDTLDEAIAALEARKDPAKTLTGDV